MGPHDRTRSLPPVLRTFADCTCRAASGLLALAVEPSCKDHHLASAAAAVACPSFDCVGGIEDLEALVAVACTARIQFVGALEGALYSEHAAY